MTRPEVHLPHDNVRDDPAQYEPAPGLESLYHEDYFDTRRSNDPKRLAQFLLEGELIRRYVRSGRVLDVGCSTGEFLNAIKWQGERYGMEISPFARQIAIENGIVFDRDLFSETDFFDLVVFRGTIHHVDEPFRFIKYAHRALRPGGFIVFLMTPNTNAPLYRLKKALPLIDPPRNFYLPDEVSLGQSLVNFGFDVRETRFPYLRTPYARPLQDHWRFLKNCLTPQGTVFTHAFWKSSMEIVAQKPV